MNTFDTSICVITKKSKIKVSPHKPILPILPKRPHQEHIKYPEIDRNLGQNTIHHPISPLLLTYLLPVHFLNIEAKTAVAYLKRKQHKWQCKVPELDQWRGRQVEQRAEPPEDKLDHLVVAVDYELDEHDHAEGVDQAQWVLGPPEVPVQVEGVVPVVG